MMVDVFAPAPGRKVWVLEEPLASLSSWLIDGAQAAVCLGESQNVEDG